MFINEAPLEEGQGGRIWLRWFADIGKALQGDWAPYTAPLSNTGDGDQVVKIINKGRTSLIQIKIQNITSAGVLTLPFEVEEAILNVWDSDTLSVLDGAQVNGNLITLPNVTGNIMITGEVIKWIR